MATISSKHLNTNTRPTFFIDTDHKKLPSMILVVVLSVAITKPQWLYNAIIGNAIRSGVQVLHIGNWKSGNQVDRLAPLDRSFTKHQLKISGSPLFCATYMHRSISRYEKMKIRSLLYRTTYSYVLYIKLTDQRASFVQARHGTSVHCIVFGVCWFGTVSVQEVNGVN